MKMTKMLTSAAMRENIPTRPLEGSTHGVSASLSCTVVTGIGSSLVLPVGILGMLEIPEGTPAPDHRKRGEVVLGRRSAGRPLQGPGVPGIVPRHLPLLRGAD